MMGLRVSFGVALGIGALFVASVASAQDSLDRDKTPAQLFASDCALCHKSPQGLAKAGGIFGLSSFLREHYTASKESAAAIAAYLEAVDRAAGAAPRERPAKRNAKGDGKPAAKKTDAKPGEAKGETPKASDAKASESKASESKPSETKPAEAKPAESKPADGKPSEAKPEAAKPD